MEMPSKLSFTQRLYSQFTLGCVLHCRLPFVETDQWKNRAIDLQFITTEEFAAYPGIASQLIKQYLTDWTKFFNTSRRFYSPFNLQPFKVIQHKSFYPFFMNYTYFSYANRVLFYIHFDFNQFNFATNPAEKKWLFTSVEVEKSTPIAIESSLILF